MPSQGMRSVCAFKQGYSGVSEQLDPVNFFLARWKAQTMLFPLVTSDLMGYYGLEIYQHLRSMSRAFFESSLHTSPLSIHHGMNYTPLLGYDFGQVNIEVLRVFP